MFWEAFGRVRNGFKNGRTKSAVSPSKMTFWREKIWSCDWLSSLHHDLAVESKRFDQASVVNTQLTIEANVISHSAANLAYLKVAMEQTDRNHKKKSSQPELPSCFMTPESPGDQLLSRINTGRMTPSFETSPSSVFLTPPCSQEKVCSPQFQSLVLDGLPKLKFELDDGDQDESTQQRRSPLLPKDKIIGRRYRRRLIGKKCVDVISELVAINCNKICQTICSYLEPLDLCRYVCILNFYAVSLKWNLNKSCLWLLMTIIEFICKLRFSSPIDLNIDLRRCSFAANNVFLTVPQFSIFSVFRFASVSSKWRSFVKQDTSTQQRWKEFLRERKDHYYLKGKVISRTFSWAWLVLVS